MQKNQFRNETVITAQRGKYLKIKGSKAKIGRPVRIIFSNTDEIPEFDEVDITPAEEE